MSWADFIRSHDGFSETLALGVSCHGAATRARSAGSIRFLQLPRAALEEAGYDQLHRAGFVKLRRPTRPMVCFINLANVDRLISSIFERFNLEWRNRTLRFSTQAA